MRSSGHKEATEDHATIAKLSTQGDNGDPEALLQNRLLNNSQVARAAMYDEADFLCVASSKQQFKVEPDEVRKVRRWSIPSRCHTSRSSMKARADIDDCQILDGLLTFSRIGDPTAASGNGEPPQHFSLGEGKVNVKNGDNDRVVGELNGKASLGSTHPQHTAVA